MMDINHHILSLIVFFPLLGAVVLALLPDRGKTMQWGALIVTLITFVFTLHLPINYAAQPTTQFRFIEDHAWISAPAIRYHLGADALGMWLVVLSGLLAPLGVLASWKAIGERTKLFYVLFLLQQVAMLGIFVALDMFLYYGFWELSLVPITILIATFGRTKDRRKAAIKYFVYAFVPSALLLVGMLWLYAKTGTFDLPKLAALAASHSISGNATALWLCSIAFLVAFAVKVPIFPLHGWLKDAIAEAPTAAVMILAGKTGLYSILRFSFAIFPEQSHRIAPLMIALGAIGIVYGALISITRKDMKELAAYSTLSHLSFVTLGIFTFTVAGLDGGMYQIINHGISGGALFLLLGFLYERYGTYDMRDFGGLAARLPWMVTLYVVTALSLIGLPMLNGFVGEFLILSGSLQALVTHHVAWTILATTGVILSAGYMLQLIQRVFYGELGPAPEEFVASDLGAREQTALWPLVALMLVMGIASPYWMQTLDTNGVAMATVPYYVEPAPPKKMEAETYPKPGFVDPDLKQAADRALDGKSGKAPDAPKGRLY
jgi:NADH-quinone oxidoreductase subunit M